MGPKLLRFFTWLLALLSWASALAEGTKQLQPSADKPCKIDILNPNATRFASYMAGPNERLQIRISNPQAEKIYFGFGIRFKGVAVPASSNVLVYYRIKDPAGNVVAGPFLLNDNGPGFITSFDQAVAGPAAVAGAAGYNALSFQPAVAGDYSIEFNADHPQIFNNVNFKFDLFDITVVNTAAQRAVPGRLWSRTWDLSTLSFANRLYAKVFIYTPDGVVTSVDYNGMQPFGYTVVANGTGLSDSGNGQADRKSSNEKRLYPEYPIFLNDPDPTVYPSGAPAMVTADPVITHSDNGQFCVNVSVSRPISVELLLDLNGQTGYQPNSADVLIVTSLNRGENCIPWNGRNGQNTPLAPGANINSSVKVLTGLVNLPVYDVENHPDGFIITLHRPPSSKQLKVFYDDSNVKIIDKSGNVLVTGTADLNGCSDPAGCHRWTKNFDATNTATVMDGSPLEGFGDEKTINTWWTIEEEPRLSVVTVPVVPAPVLGLAKAADAPVRQTDGSYDVTYTIYARNLGNVLLSGVQIEDNLTASIPAPATFTVRRVPTATGSLVANALYNGTTNKQLLAPGSTLAVGAAHTVTFTVNIRHNGFFGPFNNTAIGTATGPGNTPATDTSTSGINPDPNNTGNPGDPGEAESTPVVLPNPLIGVAKSVNTPARQADGSFEVTYTFTVRNLGNVLLRDVQVTDNLANAFPAPATFSLKGAPVTTGTLAANPAYNGVGVTGLLNSSQSTLATGATGTVSVTVILRPNGSAGPFLNTATAIANDPGQTPVQDVSTPGTDPDPGNNGNPGDPGEDKPTELVLPANPVLGIAKAVAAPVLMADRSYDVTYTLTVKNYGNTSLSGIQVTDNLFSTFPAPVVFVVKNVSATGTLTANPAFDGANNRELLISSGSSLAVGQEATITFMVNVALNGTTDKVFNNTAVGTGKGPDGTETTDPSTSGTNPDPNNNGNPNEEGENEPTPLTIDPLKIPEGFSPNGDQTHDTFYIQGVSELVVDIQIYNRWGNLVYQKKDYKNDWDGRSNTGLRMNDELPDGTYYYIIKLSDNRKFAGYLTLAR